MINPVVFTIGSLEIRAFAAWIAIGGLVGAALTLGLARLRRQPLLPWLDVLIGAALGGLIGARLGHVALNWAYFGAHQDEILNFRAGGLNWHGAVFGGLIGAALIALVRRLPLAAVLDGLALAFPLLAVGIWQGCSVSACAYGAEVRSLADYPAWLVTEAPDIYGSVAPRLNLPPLGTLLAFGVFLLAAALTALRWLPGLRLPLVLIVYGLGMAVISQFRADYAPEWFGRRGDQVLDGVVVAVGLLLALVMVVVMASGRRRASGIAAASS